MEPLSRGSSSRKSSNSNSPRSPFSSPGRPKVNESPTATPQFGFKDKLLAKFSPIIKRKQRTVSFVQDIQNSSLSDFVLIKELASGFIGKVFLAQHKPTLEYFALKVMSQEGIIAQRQLERIFNEKKIHMLLSASNSFQVVKMYKTLRDEKNVYIIMEYQPADLFSLLNQMKHHTMPEADAKFLVAVLVEALEAMHEQGVIYRDLKPQNVLIDEHGYPMLTDFGFSKILNLKGNTEGFPPQTISFVGTPAYMAPELLKRRYYAEAVDWWALGILVYEVLLGDVPFDDHGGNYDRLLNDIDKGLQFPKQLPAIAQGFIEKLLHRNPDFRLGANGVQEVKSHPWISDVDWVSIREKTMPSPLAQWIPKKSHKEPDTRNFDLYQLYESSPDSAKTVEISPHVMQEMFQGY